MEFIDKAVTKTKEYAKAAEQKAGEIYDATRIRLKIMDVKNEIARRYESIGKIVYENEKLETAEDSALGGYDELVAELDLLTEELDTLRASLADLKGEKICGSCKTSCSKEDVYCKLCGSKL